MKTTLYIALCAMFCSLFFLSGCKKELSENQRKAVRNAMRQGEKLYSPTQDGFTDKLNDFRWAVRELDDLPKSSKLSQVQAAGKKSITWCETEWFESEYGEGASRDKETADRKYYEGQKLRDEFMRCCNELLE